MMSRPGTDIMRSTAMATAGKGYGQNHTMHPYSATAAISNAGGQSTGGSGGIVGSYYSGYYGGTAHHHSVMDMPIQCPNTEPTNAAVGLQELGKQLNRLETRLLRPDGHTKFCEYFKRSTTGAENRGGRSSWSTAIRTGDAIKM